ncbi:uncharacterized protein V6R79_026362 [Siganus canaliculatus]
MKTLLIFFVVIHLQSLLRTGHCNETYDQVLSILPTTEEQVEILKNVSAEDETDLWRPVSAEFIVADAYVHLFVPAGKSQNVKDLLQTHHITYEVFVENTQRLIEMQTTNDSDVSRSSSSFYERYHNLEDIYHWINETQQENPTKVKVQIIGSSAEKRPLYVLKLSVNNSTNKKAMWIDCGIHAREWISPAFCMWFVDYSLSFYTKDQEITEILDNLDIYILPVMNPDGYKYTWTTDRMWRKNRSATKLPDCIGVDLNRNFDAKWCTKGASHFPCRETYCGVSPESEPESQAVANFLRSHKDSVQIYLTIHSYGQKLLFPYSYTYDKVPNHDDLFEIAEEAAKKIQTHFHNNYTYGPGADTIYLAPGGSDDWAYDQGIKYSFTFELQDLRQHGFLLPPSEIPQACQEALTAVKTVALKVIEKTRASTPKAPETMLLTERNIMKTLLILFIVIHLQSLLRTGHCDETDDEVLLIIPTTLEQAELVKNVSAEDEIELWRPAAAKYIRVDTFVHLFVPAGKSQNIKDLLQTHDITYEVIAENTQRLIEMQTRNNSSFHERFHTLDDIYHWINKTQQENPTKVKVQLIGSSAEKRPLYVLKLSVNNSTNKKAMWLDCGIHAREWISPAFCMWFVDHSLEYYTKEQEITEILDNLDIYILPVMNPDGYKYTWITLRNRIWRKNRFVNQTSGCVGVDLNRNFPTGGWCTTGASNDSCSITYCGAYPESESESQAVANFLLSHKDSVQIYLTIHAHAQMLLFPYSYTFDKVPNHDELFEIVEEAAQKIQTHFHNNYTYGAGAETIYLAPGGSDDWAYDHGIKYTFTFELQDHGRYGFLLPPSRIPEACQEALTAVKTVALKVIEKTRASTPKAPETI